MIEKQFYCDDPLEYRNYGIFDLSKADKTLEDFRDEDNDICMPLFRCYLCDETDSMLTGEEVTKLLNKQNAIIKALAEELNYIQNSITDKIKHQKTKIGEKALKEVIEDYNEWMLGHK